MSDPAGVGFFCYCWGGGGDRRGVVSFFFVVEECCTDRMGAAWIRRERAVSERAGEMRGSIVYPERRAVGGESRVFRVNRVGPPIEWLPPYLHTMCTMHQCGRGNCNDINEK